ncbi:MULTISPECIES: hypothetical protein [Bacteroides]|uniref:Uncharacterized protein n=3 Tax=Bacteroides TaxID=816 RepID=A0AAP9SUA2_BACFG|nr:MULTISPECIES: hypothetical protein [Bacteroides]EFR53565.1 hypothetical protein BFAG_02260 [Bacteroides fragilis 3_1_12]MBM6511850.1 hypothetical protein [Bacteroides fragilis]MDV6165918.1 hypothetical protein [Bacteroides hominis (ex Liu et al. 2022)]QKH83161.1 hypothetical protein FOC69_01835 [Bacteroides fragilis]
MLATYSTEATTSTTAYTATTPAMHRKSFKEQETAIFSIIGFAVAYIAALIIHRIIKTRKAQN